MAFRVKFLHKAETDLAILHQWLVENAPVQGPQWFNGLEQAILSLARNPNRCPLVHRLSTDRDQVRQLLYGTKPHIYKVFFHIVGDTVEVLHIRHGARRAARRWELFN